MKKDCLSPSCTHHIGHLLFFPRLQKVMHNQFCNGPMTNPNRRWCLFRFQVNWNLSVSFPKWHCCYSEERHWAPAHELPGSACTQKCSPDHTEGERTSPSAVYSLHCLTNLTLDRQGEWAVVMTTKNTFFRWGHLPHCPRWIWPERNGTCPVPSVSGLRKHMIAMRPIMVCWWFLNACACLPRHILSIGHDLFCPANWQILGLMVRSIIIERLQAHSPQDRRHTTCT